VRRTRESTSAARTASDKGGGGREPNRRPNASKPDATAEIVDTAGELTPGLYLVATPIGNLGDVTARALDILRQADRIFCEDTRVTRRLLARYGIAATLEAYHDHNAERARPAVLAALRRGERVALVSDAGTPLLSDPGYKLVRAAIAEGLAVTAAPGPSAAVTALILSGLPPDRFFFAGFLPPRQAARRRALETLRGLDATLIFYEGASRLGASLSDMAEVFGGRGAAVARELTKLHEEVRRGGLIELARHYHDAEPPRGEIVIVVGPPRPPEPDLAGFDERLRAAVEEFGVRDAAVKLAAETGLPRTELYRRALALRGGERR
jgi:16S rRNA (cytidine1402-2'-O)-methyltransferase